MHEMLDVSACRCCGGYAKSLEAKTPSDRICMAALNRDGGKIFKILTRRIAELDERCVRQR